MVNFDPSEISDWASKSEAPDKLPALIRRLIMATTIPTRLDIPAGSAVWHGGWDGVVVTETENPWVPDGISAWELSCRSDITAKANSDYHKRTNDPLGVDRTNATFVFVTPRTWSDKQKWIAEKRAAGEWAEVRAFDASDIAAWLAQAPAVAAWFARLIGKLPASGYIPLDEWWENWATISQPNIDPKLVLAGRQENADKVREWVQQPPAHYYVQGQTREEAIAFVAASALNSDDPRAATLLAKTLVVKSEEAWHSLTHRTSPLDTSPLDTSPLVLIRAFDGNASPQVAVSRGNHVITPLYASEEPKGNGMTLPRLGREESVTALTDMGLSETKARALARKTARNLPIIRRFLIDEAGGPTPAWASTDAQSALPALVLVGQWDEYNEADKESIAHIAAKPYDDIANEVAALAQTEDSPLSKIGNHWRFICHEETWHLLAPHLAATTVKRFQETATAILSVVSPKFEMPIGERHLAGIHGKTLPHSELLREGIARTLALMGNQCERAKNVPNVPDVPELVLQRVFAENTEWEIWATLDRILPTLAEAAPEALLSTIEQRITEKPNPFASLFAQEGGSLFSDSVHTGLTWALEKLAWTSQYFTRAAVVLAKLALIDPGGTIANRPARSLAEMFLPWHRVSETPDAKRLETMETLLKRHPKPSWQALVNAYPSFPGDVVVERTPPTWRPWGQDGAMHPTQEEYYAFVKEMERLLLEHVGHDADRWRDIVGIMSRPSSDAYWSATDLMMQRISDIRAQPGSVALWAKLRQELHLHRTHPDANWAMPAAELEPLAAIYEQLTPDDPVQAYGWLFDAWPKPPEGLPRNVKARSAQIDAERQTVITAAYESGSDRAILYLAESTQAPEEVGRAFAIGVGTEPALALAVQHAGSDNRKLAEMARGVLWTIYRQSGWDGLEDAIARLKAANAQPQALATAFLVAPARPDTWQRLAKEETATQRCYWERLNLFQVPDEDEEGLRFAAERLLSIQRSPAVADRIAYASVYHEIVIQTLEQLPADLTAGKETEPGIANLIHPIVNLLESLDASSAVGDDVIAYLELPFLPALHSGGRPNLALYRVISSEPALFADLVTSLYKRDDGQTDAMGNAQAIPVSSEIYVQIIFGAGEMPGKTKDGNVDYERLSTWVNEARRLCAERGRTTGGDNLIGHLLTKSPDGEDGAWPGEPVRELLESLPPTGVQRIGNGFVSGRMSQRGVTSRSAFAGGDQERELTHKYRQHAAMMDSKWPHTATLLRRIADAYQRQAQQHDRESEELDQFGF